MVMISIVVLVYQTVPIIPAVGTCFRPTPILMCRVMFWTGNQKPFKDPYHDPPSNCWKNPKRLKHSFQFLRQCQRNKGTHNLTRMEPLSFYLEVMEMGKSQCPVRFMDLIFTYCWVYLKILGKKNKKQDNPMVNRHFPIFPPARPYIGWSISHF